MSGSSAGPTGCLLDDLAETAAVVVAEASRLAADRGAEAPFEGGCPATSGTAARQAR